MSDPASARPLATSYPIPPDLPMCIKHLNDAVGQVRVGPSLADWCAYGTHGDENGLWVWRCRAVGYDSEKLFGGTSKCHIERRSSLAVYLKSSLPFEALILYSNLLTGRQCRVQTVCWSQLRWKKLDIVSGCWRTAYLRAIALT